MGVMVLRRESTNQIMSDHVYAWTGWDPSYEQPRPKTITGRSILVETSVMEIESRVTLMFANHYTNATIARMYQFWEYAHDQEVFTFTDLSGSTYDVQIADKIQSTRMEDFKHRSIYLNECLVLRTGFIR